MRLKNNEPGGKEGKGTALHSTWAGRHGLQHVFYSLSKSHKCQRELNVFEREVSRSGVVKWNVNSVAKAQKQLSRVKVKPV